MTPWVNVEPEELCGLPSTSAWSSSEDHNASCFPDGKTINSRMNEQRCFHKQPPAAAQPPPHPNQSAISINWREDASIVIKMRRGHVQMATHSGDMKLKPGCSQADGAQFALDAHKRKSFAFRSGRRTV